MKNVIHGYLGEDPEEHLEHMREAFGLLSKKEALVKAMEHGRKAVLSNVESGIRALDPSLAQNAIESRAHGSEDYKQWLLRYQKAIEDYRLCELNYWNDARRWDYLMKQIDLGIKMEAWKAK